jgi:hypothetical protein
VVFAPVVASNKPIVERLNGHESIMAIKDRIWTIHTAMKRFQALKVIFLSLTSGEDFRRKLWSYLWYSY